MYDILSLNSLTRASMHCQILLSMNTKKQINYYWRTTGFVSAGKNNRGMKIIKVLHILLVKAKLDR